MNVLTFLQNAMTEESGNPKRSVKRVRVVDSGSSDSDQGDLSEPSGQGAGVNIAYGRKTPALDKLLDTICRNDTGN